MGKDLLNKAEAVDSLEVDGDDTDKAVLMTLDEGLDAFLDRVFVVVDV